MRRLTPNTAKETFHNELTLQAHAFLHIYNQVTQDPIFHGTRANTIDRIISSSQPYKAFGVLKRDDWVTYDRGTLKTAYRFLQDTSIRNICEEQQIDKQQRKGWTQSWKKKHPTLDTQLFTAKTILNELNLQRKHPIYPVMPFLDEEEKIEFYKCGRKQAFTDEKTAQSIAQENNCKTYYCLYCHHYHNGHQPKTPKTEDNLAFLADRAYYSRPERRDARKGEFNTLIVTQKDRLTRFGYSYLEEFFSDHNVSIRILGEEKQKTLQEELLQDFMSLIASFSGKFYRLRGYEQQKTLLNKAEDILNEKTQSTH